MIKHRNLLLFLTVIMLALLIGACGNEESSSDESGSAPKTKSGESKTTVPEPGSVDAAEEKLGAAASFALTPAITACMTKAGFTQDAPPTGALVAWRHPSGARVVVASSGDVTLGIASEIGTQAAPANVDGTTVVSGAPEQSAAATKCLAA